jgi:integrase
VHDFSGVFRAFGLGQAEAGSLTRADVDFEREQIITFRHKTSQGFAVPISPQLRLTTGTALWGENQSGQNL